jgi:hypothetical protein
MGLADLDVLWQMRKRCLGGTKAAPSGRKCNSLDKKDSGWVYTKPTACGQMLAAVIGSAVWSRSPLRWWEHEGNSSWIDVRGAYAKEATRFRTNN